LGIAKGASRLELRLTGIAVSVLARIDLAAFSANDLARGRPIGGDDGGVARLAGERLVGVNNSLYWGATGRAIQGLKFHCFQV